MLRGRMHVAHGRGDAPGGGPEFGPAHPFSRSSQKNCKVSCVTRARRVGAVSPCLEPAASGEADSGRTSDLTLHAPSRTAGGFAGATAGTRQESCALWQPAIDGAAQARRLHNGRCYKTHHYLEFNFAHIDEVTRWAKLPLYCPLLVRITCCVLRPLVYQDIQGHAQTNRSVSPKRVQKAVP